MCSQVGQGNASETRSRDLRSQLLEAEAAHLAKRTNVTGSGGNPEANSDENRQSLESPPNGAESSDAKRRRILEETRTLDAESDGSDSESSDERCAAMALGCLRISLTKPSDEEDETAELMRELEKIKRERAEQKAKEVLHRVIRAHNLAFDLTCY